MRYTLALLYLLLSCLHNEVSAQTASNELAPGYYVVVGAYSETKEDYAKRFVDSLNKNGNNASYGFNPSRSLFFVYLNYYPTLKESLKSMERSRHSGKFVDAWVRVVPGVISTISSPAEPVTAKNPVTTTPVDKDPKQEPPVVTADSAKPAVDYSNVTDNPEIKQYEHMTLGNTEVFLSLYNATNNRIVDGDIQVVDTDRAKQLMKVKGNEYLLLPDPKSKSGQLTLICDVFGYRKIQNEINYPVPLADTVKSYVDLMGTTVVINFDLVRYRKGDISTLYNVYFYNDAAIMLPDSKFELNNLLQMMQENPKYRIRLHGHTNGNYHGKIVTLGADKNFFSLTGAKESIGSSAELSEQRAQVIKEYLISKGIDASRIEVKAWGGKRPLYDKNSVNAKKNVRVEVEMIEE
jgi:outer membrane protein OmpA-like peptidoglycan-associated protein